MPSRIPPVGTRISVTREKRGTSIRVRLRWTVDGVQTGTSRTFPRSRDREEEMARYVESVRMTKRTRTVPGLALSGFVEKIEDQWLEHLAPTTSEAYRAAWANHVKPFLGDTDVSALDARRVRALGRSIERDSTRRNSLAALSRICQQAVDLGYLTGNPVRAAEVRRRTTPERERQILVNEEDFYAQFEEPWRDFFKLTQHLALRSGETCGLQAQDYQRDRRVVRIERQVDNNSRIRPPKGGRPRTVPVDPTAAAILDRVTRGKQPGEHLFLGPRGGVLIPGAVRRRSGWTDAAEAVGQPDLHIHDLRHTGLTHLLRRLNARGQDVETLRVIAGHSSIRTTQTYLHTDEDTISAAAAALWD